MPMCVYANTGLWGAAMEKLEVCILGSSYSTYSPIQTHRSIYWGELSITVIRDQLPAEHIGKWPSPTCQSLKMQGIFALVLFFFFTLIFSLAQALESLDYEALPISSRRYQAKSNAALNIKEKQNKPQASNTSLIFCCCWVGFN